MVRGPAPGTGRLPAACHIRPGSVLLRIVAPVHQRVTPVAGGRVALARTLRQMAVNGADHLAHVVEVIVAQVRRGSMQQRDDAPAGLVPDGFAIAMLLPTRRGFSLASVRARQPSCLPPA